MFKQSFIVFFLISIGLIHSLPHNITESHEDTQEHSAEEHSTMKMTREIRTKVDGSTHQVKSTGITYRQRIQGEHCFVEHNGELLAEMSVIQIRKRYYRVEDCSLERVFHACGPNLIYMLNIVCRVVEQDQQGGRDAFNGKRHLYRDSSENPMEKYPRTITESCCENLCNVAELTRYCHKQ